MVSQTVESALPPFHVEVYVMYSDSTYGMSVRVPRDTKTDRNDFVVEGNRCVIAWAYPHEVFDIC